LSVTDGSRVRIDCAGISVQPDRGWGFNPFDVGHQDPAKPQICAPALLRREGAVTTMLMPKSSLPLQEQAQAFVKKLSLEDLRQEEVTAQSGARMVHAVGISTKNGKDAAVRIQVDFFFLLNAQGQMVVVYDAGRPEENERFVEWFRNTVQL